MTPSMASQSSIIWNYFTKISTGKDRPVAANCNSCNNSMESDPDNTSRLSNHLRLHHKPLHNELEEVMRNLSKSPSGRGLSLVNENVPAAPKMSSLRNFRLSKKALQEVKGKAPDSGKLRLKSLFESLLRQARKADGQPAESNNAGIIENAVGQSISNLINGSIDTETFHEDLQKALNSQPQPALVPFIKGNLQPLKTSMRSGVLSIVGLKESKAAKPVMAVRPTLKVAKAVKPVKPMRAPYALRNLRVSAARGASSAVVATPCNISRKEKSEEKKNTKFEGVCLLALTGTHDCSVDHDQENVPPQEQAAQQGNEVAKTRGLRDIRIIRNRNKAKGTF